ncbi:hypothetical protein BT67DRAFT_409669 [Trichocladium antarcticum]|uniref:Zn(2)-C6 fungal-type domain-containing protein n=1 Tax=Trichocladium antarcticum TaxID=1450529 RepID=A0AAN6ZB48_9PEZI|nr:hypothetical protein BT67DRAFT_409669 [Trichocladium antarcticum]
MDEDKKPPRESGDAEMQQSYPSPMIDSTDTQYYHQLASHRDHDAQMNHPSGQPEHDGLPTLSQHQEQHEDHGLHELQELQEPPTPHHHNARPPVSVDELQLAAQLTQGLAPMMAAARMDAAQDQSQGQQPPPQQEPGATPQSEPNLQEQLEASLQNHEREMQGHDHDLQNHNHGLQDHELEDVMPAPGQPQTHHYPQNPPPPPHLPPHLSMDHIARATTQYQLPDTTPPRKRSKVSRACDECRRKKIKCDAQSEATEQACSNCRRSNVQCLFSRVPQKRGPSKGYIKELADRINTIEGKLNTNVDSLDTMARRSSSEAFGAPGVVDDSRKRPFSSVSGEAYQTPSPSRVQGTTTEHRPLLPMMSHDYRNLNAATAHDLALKPAAPMQSPMQYSGSANDISLQGQAEPIMVGLSQHGLPPGSSHQAEQLPEIEDAAFDRYLEAIHPSFPVLASTKMRVQSLLYQLPLALQSAFYNALSAMVKPFLPGPENQASGHVFAACRQLNEWEAERLPRSAATDLVRLQTLVMVIIALDGQGIASVKGELGGPSKAEIIGRAVGLAYSMRLHLRQVDPDASPELDPNSDDNVALRAWWVLVMLDRWNAIGTATPTLINNESVVTLPGLKHIVGDVVYALIQTSYVLGYFIPIALAPPPDPHHSHPTQIPTTTMPIMAVEVLRWVFPTDSTEPVLYLTYWHIRLLSELFAPPTRLGRPANVLQAAGNMVRLLASNPDLQSPLTHHFLALASLALLELCAGGDVDGDGDGDGAVRDEAARLAGLVLEFAVAPSPWNDAVRERLAAVVPLPLPLPPAVAGSAQGEAEVTSQNLQQLADLATAVENSVAAAAAEDQLKEEPLVSAAAGADKAGGNRDGVGIAHQAAVDVRALLREGYLACFEGPTGDGLPP